MISVVLSFRNEADIIPELISRLDAVFKGIKTDYELLFVNDDSTDDSLEVLEERCKTDSRIKVINMTRRFGISECVIAGMAHSEGDAVIYMDSDLQDPPEVIPDLVAKWKDGADIVHTVRSERKCGREIASATSARRNASSRSEVTGASVPSLRGGSS